MNNYKITTNFGEHKTDYIVPQGHFIENEEDALAWVKEEIYFHTDPFVWENDGHKSFESWFENCFEVAIEKLELDEKDEEENE